MTALQELGGVSLARAGSASWACDSITRDDKVCDLFRSDSWSDSCAMFLMPRSFAYLSSSERGSQVAVHGY